MPLWWILRIARVTERHEPHEIAKSQAGDAANKIDIVRETQNGLLIDATASPHVPFDGVPAV